MNKFLTLAVLALGASSLHASISYSNGTPNYAAGDGINNFNEADNFSYSSPTDFNHVMFQVISGNIGLAYTGTISWYIQSNSSGAPGTVLASGTTSPTPVLAQGYSTYYAYQFDFDIPLFSAAANTQYWLVLHAGAPGTPGGFGGLLWVAATGGDGVIGQQMTLLSPPPQPWQPSTQDHFFQLSTPEPGSLLLLASGLGILIARRKRT